MALEQLTDHLAILHDCKARSSILSAVNTCARLCQSAISLHNSELDAVYA